MGWFTKDKIRYHFVINKDGKVIGDVSSKMLDFLLRELSDDFEVDAKGARYLYSGIPRKIGEPACGHIMLDAGYKITCASHEG